MSDLIYEEESYRIRGAAFDVYKEMGCGFLEPVYQECMEKELLIQGIPFEVQQELTIQYKGEPLKHRYVPDFMCFEKIIVEIKAVKEVNNEHKAQLMNYLKATKFKLGFLINFGHHPGVEIVRIVL